MKIEILLGLDVLDYNEELNVEYSLRDFLSTDVIKNNTSFTINLPLTDFNKEKLGFIDEIASKKEISTIASIRIDNSQILTGILRVLEITDRIKIIITNNKWLENIEAESIQDLDFSAYNHTLNEENIIDANAADDSFYRYPLINHRVIFSQFYPNCRGCQDMSVFLRVKDIYEKIFYPYTLQESLDTYIPNFQDYYFSTNWLLKEDDFLDTTWFCSGMDTNFERIMTIPTDYAGYVLLFNGNTQNWEIVPFNDDSNDPFFDDGTNYNTGTFKYTIPEDGAYFFKTRVAGTIDAGPYDYITNVDPEVTIFLKRNRGGNIVTLNIRGTDYIHMDGEGNFDLTFCNDDFRWFLAGDLVYIIIEIKDYVTTAVGYGGYYKVTYNKTKCFFKCFTNKFPANEFPVIINDILPAISKLDFIKGINHLFNLIPFIDEQTKTIYVMPYKKFYSINIKDWSGKINHNKELTIKNISTDLKKTLRLRFKEDSFDKYLNDYNKNHNTQKGEKIITLESIYAIKGEEKLENPVFSTFISQYVYQYQFILYDFTFGSWTYEKENGITNYTSAGQSNLSLPIISSASELQGEKWEKIGIYNTKICYYTGLTSGNWKFCNTTYNTYPRIIALSYVTLYGTYWWHEIKKLDKGKLIEAECIIDAKDIIPFDHVVNTYDEEGFMVKYKFKYRDNYFYGYIHRIVYNGSIAKLEIIKA